MLIVFEGVTQVGARAQIERQLNDREDIQGDKWKMAAYLAGKVCLIFTPHGVLCLPCHLDYCLYW